MRRVFVIVALLAGLAGVATFQLTQRHVANADARVFVPSSRFYLDFSPSFRTTIADAYWLSTVQYYGEHLKSDGRFDSLAAMLDLVTELSPRFVRPYQFGAYALLVDGECRKAAAPKKKKLMHVFVTPHRADGIAQALSSGSKPLDSDFRKALAALGYRNRQE